MSTFLFYLYILKNFVKQQEKECILSGFEFSKITVQIKCMHFLLQNEFNSGCVTIYSAH